MKISHTEEQIKISWQMWSKLKYCDTGGTNDNIMAHMEQIKI